VIVNNLSVSASTGLSCMRVFSTDLRLCAPALGCLAPIRFLVMPFRFLARPIRRSDHRESSVQFQKNKAEACGKIDNVLLAHKLTMTGRVASSFRTTGDKPVEELLSPNACPEKEETQMRWEEQPRPCTKEQLTAMRGADSPLKISGEADPRMDRNIRDRSVP
jgi:hypothetical protein